MSKCTYKSTYSSLISIKKNKKNNINIKILRALTREGDIYGTPLTLAHSDRDKKD